MNTFSQDLRDNTLEHSGECIAFTRRYSVQNGETSTPVEASPLSNVRDYRVTPCLRDDGCRQGKNPFEESEWFRLLIENTHNIVNHSLVHPADQIVVKNMISEIFQPDEPVTAHTLYSTQTMLTDEFMLLHDETGTLGTMKNIMHDTYEYNKNCERLKRIQILLNTKKNIQKEKSWDRGLKIIFRCISMLGFERYGIFLVNPVRKKLELHSAKDITLSEDVMHLKDSEYIGVKCIKEKKIIHVKEYPNHGTGEPTSYVWIPIIVQDTPFAALVADTMKKPSTEEDIEDLKALAGMCAAFIDRTRIKIEPVTEEIVEKPPKYHIDPLEAYIILEKKCEKSLEIFSDIVSQGIPGIVISRVYPEKIKRRCTLVQTPVLWLSRIDGENTVAPADLYKLAYALEDFTRKSTESVILFDGVEYLMTQTSFEETLRYMHELKDIAFVNNARLIVSLHKDTLTLQEYTMLKKEFVMYEPATPFSVLMKGWNQITKRLETVSPSAIPFTGKRR
jgi:hypothetical protein